MYPTQCFTDSVEVTFSCALRHEDVWGSGCIYPLYPHWIGGLDDVETRRILPLPGHELRPLGRPASRYTDCATPALFI
jgi:hypothetical protein